jgi:hypothetical protein
MFCVLQECTNLETTHYFRSGRQQVILNKVFESGLDHEPFRSCRGNNCFRTSGPKMSAKVLLWFWMNHYGQKVLSCLVCQIVCVS